MGSTRFSVRSAPQGLYDTSANQLAPLGAVLDLGDGREFVYCEVGGVAAVAGSMYQSEVPEAADFVAMALDVPLVGTRVIEVTPAGTAVLLENEASEGFLFLSTGETYKISGHLATVAATAFDVTIADGLVETIAGATTGTITKNKHKDVIIAASTTITAVAIGVPIRDHALDAFGWFQRKGTCAILTQGTVVIGDAVASGTVAGSVAPLAAGTAETIPIYGQCEVVGANGLHSFISLNLG